MKTIFTLLFTIVLSLPILAQDTAKAKDIRKLLELTGSIKVGIQAMDAGIELQKKTNTTIPAEFWVEFRKGITEDAFAQMIVPIYDKHFTHQEITELIAFYQTPIGQKTTQVLPILTQESMTAGQELGKRIGQNVVEKLKAEGKL
ncbi:DUF2059 domain-containing protein [Adhaeribacter arboris]|uniref:DUF2059 domain-containing protein n=1 Tax=Adhaeribacter arboris TaxID=2072846 RepID=A0A2T2YD42_9BACT|nr:DUF2059 domain-containing protein [Adhaeribacter arboris]PSR53440.1 DUF2059 domain-containing protein [Adhaeribacter arboris]